MNPSVQVALIGHSMGGIVIADTLLSIAQETVIGGSPDDLPSTENSSQDPRMKSDPAPPLLFPRILCLLAFDTPYLGISPGVLSHGVEQHYSTATSAYSALSTIWPGTSSKQAPTPPASSHAAIKAPPPQAAAAAVATGGSSWTRSLLYGATALTAAGLAAGVAYASREHISRAATASRATFSTGYEFASSHMLFVGTLVKPEVLKRRLAGMRQVGGERGIPWACLYTVLGSGAGAGAKKSGVGTEGERRTFCNLPAGKLGDAEGLGGGGLWVPALNEKAVDAVAAHTGMFFPAENPNYYALAEKSKELIASWMEKSIPL